MSGGGAHWLCYWYREHSNGSAHSLKVNRDKDINLKYIWIDTNVGRLVDKLVDSERIQSNYLGETIRVLLKNRRYIVIVRCNCANVGNHLWGDRL